MQHIPVLEFPTDVLLLWKAKDQLRFLPHHSVGDKALHLASGSGEGQDSSWLRRLRCELEDFFSEPLAPLNQTKLVRWTQLSTRDFSRCSHQVLLGGGAGVRPLSLEGCH